MKFRGIFPHGLSNPCRGLAPTAKAELSANILWVSSARCHDIAVSASFHPRLSSFRHLSACRSEMIYSCHQCQITKRKCDRKYNQNGPCGQCVLRNCQEKCRPGKSIRGHNPDAPPPPAVKRNRGRRVTEMKKAGGTTKAARKGANDSRRGAKGDVQTAKLASLSSRSKVQSDGLFLGPAALPMIVQKMCVGGVTATEGSRPKQDPAHHSVNVPEFSTPVIDLSKLSLSVEVLRFVLDHFCLRNSMAKYVSRDVLFTALNHLSDTRSSRDVESTVSVRLLLVVLAYTLVSLRREDLVFEQVKTARTQNAATMIELYLDLSYGTVASLNRGRSRVRTPLDTEIPTHIMSMVFYSLYQMAKESVDAAYIEIADTVATAYSVGLYAHSCPACDKAWRAVLLVESQLASFLSRPNLIQLQLVSSFNTTFRSLEFRVCTWVQNVNMQLFVPQTQQPMPGAPGMLVEGEFLLSECDQTHSDSYVAHNQLYLVVNCLKIILLCMPSSESTIEQFLRHINLFLSTMVSLHRNAQFAQLMSEPVLAFNIFQFGVLLLLKMIQIKLSPQTSASNPAFDSGLWDRFSSCKATFFRTMDLYKFDVEWCFKFFAFSFALQDLVDAKVDRLNGSLMFPGFSVPLDGLSDHTVRSDSQSMDNVTGVGIEIGMDLMDALSRAELDYLSEMFHDAGDSV